MVVTDAVLVRRQRRIFDKTGKMEWWSVGVMEKKHIQRCITPILQYSNNPSNSLKGSVPVKSAAGAGTRFSRRLPVLARG
jgi:hypothetical protein